MVPANPQQLLNTSWTAHRLSPLYHEEYQSILGNDIALKVYAKRLKDLLTADLLGGIQVVIVGNNPSDDALSKTGALKECRWETIAGWSWWMEYRSTIEEDDEEQQEQIIPIDDMLGILITLEYENAIYKAALLVDVEKLHTPQRGKALKSTYLPLLLTRFPTPLRQTFTNFVCSTFDVYCSVLRVPSSFLCASIENHISTLASGGEDAEASSSYILENIMKEVQLTLTFAPPIAPALKSIEISLPRETLSSFSQVQTTNEFRDSDNRNQSPFLWSLTKYFDRHLAMTVDLNSLWDKQNKVSEESVRLTKVACGAFVISADGRVKFIADPMRDMSIDRSGATGEDDLLKEKSRLILVANNALLQSLVRRAVGADFEKT